MAVRGKEFIVLGTVNGCMRNAVFPHFAALELFIGIESPKVFVDRDGNEKKFGNIKWFTTFDMPRKPLPPCVDKCACKYDTFANAPGINVNRLKDIPCGYEGVMGVPTTFLEHDYGDYRILGLNLVPKLEGGGTHSNACSYTRIYTRILIRHDKRGNSIAGDQD